MDDTEFDKALVGAAFAQAAVTGWPSLSIVEAARSAGLPLDRTRERFPGPGAVLKRFGVLADAAVLADPVSELALRDRLFDLVMRRFDFLELHRAGMVALLRDLPGNPLLVVALGGATVRSMAWLMEAAGAKASGLRGQLRAQGLVAVWLYALRAWRTDDSADLSRTMAALNKALDQAERFDGMLGASPAAAEDPLEGVIDLPDEPTTGSSDPYPSTPPPPPSSTPLPPPMQEPPASPV